MALVLPKVKSFGEEFGSALGGGLGQGFSSGLERSKNQIQEEKYGKRLSELTGEDLTGLPLDFQKMAYEYGLKNQNEASKLRGGAEEDQKNYQTVKENFGEKFANVWKAAPEGGKTQMITAALDSIQRGDDLAGLLDFSKQDMNESDENSTISPKKPPGITPKEWAKQKSTQLYDINKPILKEADDIRKNLALQEQAIEDLMQSSPDVGIRDWVADFFDFEPLRSESGAKFKTAVKDFFLTDIARVGARPNQWVEKQLLSALPVAGRTPTSNMITTAGLEFKKDLAKERLRILDELTDKYGYSEIDLSKTTNKMMKSYVVERQKLLEDQIRGIKNRESKLSGKMIRVIDPNGEEYEIDESEVELLPEGYLIK